MKRRKEDRRERVDDREHGGIEGRSEAYRRGGGREFRRMREGRRCRSGGRDKGRKMGNRRMREEDEREENWMVDSLEGWKKGVEG